MAKKIKLESFIYHLLLKGTKRKFINKNNPKFIWLDFIDLLDFQYDSGFCIIVNKKDKSVQAKIKLSEYIHCLKGDNLDSTKNKSHEYQFYPNDPVKSKNDIFIQSVIKDIANKNNFFEENSNV